MEKKNISKNVDPLSQIDNINKLNHFPFHITNTIIQQCLILQYKFMYIITLRITTHSTKKKNIIDTFTYNFQWTVIHMSFEISLTSLLISGKTEPTPPLGPYMLPAVLFATLLVVLFSWMAFCTT